MNVKDYPKSNDVKVIYFDQDYQQISGGKIPNCHIMGPFIHNKLYS